MRQRHQSAIRGWRSNFVNFILEHSKKRAIGGVVARAEFGVPGRGCSPTHDGDSIYRKHCRTAITDMLYEQAVTLAVGSRLSRSRQRHVISTALDFYTKPASFVQIV
ncbi:hypothetical protein Zmor_014200 [Zophobas morio]|uniref:Uncharacterized protein n=1 Tax=Zophobas morio TaxID=2755281 RepID=A0AA38MGC8_9CUCU|nr:hypothetical protein Zmor_014200 [Zophobas morio]